MAPIRVLPAASSLEHRLRQYAGRQDPTKHGSYLGRVTLFGVTEPRKEGGRDPHLGWDGVAAGGVEVYEVPGDHFTLLEEPHVQMLAAQLKSCLDQPQADSS